eukprot:3256173-Alexandrium_andersonii.AAC.1
MRACVRACVCFTPVFSGRGQPPGSAVARARSNDGHEQQTVLDAQGGAGPREDQGQAEDTEVPD